MQMEVFCVENIVYQIRLYIASTFKPSCEATIEPLKHYTLYRVTVPQRIRDAFGIVLGVIQIIALYYLALVREGEDKLSTSGSRRKKKQRNKAWKSEKRLINEDGRLPKNNYSSFLMGRATYLVSCGNI